MISKRSILLVPVVLITITITAALNFPPQASLLARAGNQDRTALQQQIRVVYRVTDVVVRDAEGNCVRGLSADDFVLEIDGKRVDVKSIDEFETPDLKDEDVVNYLQWAAETAEGDSEPPPPPTPPRYIIMVFDRFNMGIAGTRESIKSAKDILNNSLMPYDRVAVFVYNGTMRMLCRPTSDRTQIIAAIEKANTASNNSHYRPETVEIFPPIKDKRQQQGPGERQKIVNWGDFDRPWHLKRILQEKAADFKNYMESMNALALALEALPGRKTYLLFSEGPNIYNPMNPMAMGGTIVDRGSPDLAAGAYLPPHLVTTELQELARRISSTNSSIYTIRRGPIQPEWMMNMDIDTAGHVDKDFAVIIQKVTRDMHDNRLDVLRQEASLTNGKFFDAGMSDQDLTEEIRQEVGNYYLLGFVPPEGKQGSYHGLKVRTVDDSYRVVHRDGFYEESSIEEMTAAEKAIHLEGGFLAPRMRNELGLDVRAHRLPMADGHQLLISLNLLSGNIAKLKRGSRELELVINVEDQKGNIRYRTHKIFQNKREGLPQSLWLTEVLPVIDGGCTVYLAMRDNACGRRSAWKHETGSTKAPMGALHLGRPILLSDDRKGDLSGWKTETIKDSVNVIDPVIPAEFKIAGKPLFENAVKQGGEATVAVIIGNLPEDTDPSKLDISVSFVLNPNEEQGYILTAENQKIRFISYQRMLMITAKVPLGLAQRDSGQLCVMIDGLRGRQKILSSVQYKIQDFSAGRAEELLEDYRISEMP